MAVFDYRQAREVKEAFGRRETFWLSTQNKTTAKTPERQEIRKIFLGVLASWRFNYLPCLTAEINSRGLANE